MPLPFSRLCACLLAAGIVLAGCRSDTRASASPEQAVAELELGRKCEEGIGMPKNYDEARRHYRKAADLGLVDGWLAIGNSFVKHGPLPGTQEAALIHESVRTEAEKGNARAQAAYGGLVMRGIGQLPSKSEAVEWYRKAADQGDAYAHLQLGLLIYRADGVAQNMDEAVDHFEAAAQGGQAEAMYMLGIMHQMGEGVPLNPIEAYRWYKMGDAHGYAPGRSMEDLKTYTLNASQLRIADEADPALPVARKH